MDAFSTPARLGVLLNRTFTPDEGAWIEALLEDASAYLRGVIGQNVYPVTTSTYTDWPTSGRLDLPQFPVVSIGSVKRNDVIIPHTYRPGYILVDCDEAVSVTYTWGYADAPEELARLANVLVSQALITVENGVGLTAGGLSSLALDDFKVAWADAGASSGMTISDTLAASLRRQFGKGDTAVAETGW